MEVVRTVWTVLVCWSRPFPSTTTAGLMVEIISAASRILDAGTQVISSTRSACRPVRNPSTGRTQRSTS